MSKLNDADATLRAERVLATGSDPADFSEALARGLRIITAFTPERRTMTLAELAREVNLPRATVRRSLTTLVHLGYLAVDGRRFTLTVKVLELATAYLGANAISLVVQPMCERLSQKYGLVCSTAVLDGDSAVMVARSAPRQVLDNGAGIGYRVPVLHSALGRVLLSALPDEELRERLKGVRLTALTERSITDKKVLLNVIAAAREAGYAYVDREAEKDFRSVAVPLRRWDGKVIGAVNIGASTGSAESRTMTGPILAGLKEAVAEAASQIL